MMASASDVWITSELRQSVITKINETIDRARVSLQNNAAALESQIFSKSQSKAEYIKLVFGLLDCINKMALKTYGSRPKQANVEQATTSLQTVSEVHRRELMGMQSSDQMKMQKSQSQMEKVQIQPAIVTQQSQMCQQQIQQPQMIRQVFTNQQTVGNLQKNQSMIYGQQFPNSQLPAQIQEIKPKLEAQQGEQERKIMSFPNQPQRDSVSQHQTKQIQVHLAALQRGPQMPMLESSVPKFITVDRCQSPRRQQFLQNSNQFNFPSLFQAPPLVGTTSVQPSSYFGPVGASRPTANNGKPSRVYLMPNYLANPNMPIPPAGQMSQSLSANPTLITSVPMAFPSPSPRNAQIHPSYQKIMDLQKYKSLLEKMIIKIGDKDAKSNKMKQIMDILNNPNKVVSMELLSKCEAALIMIEKQYEETTMLGNAASPVPRRIPVSPFHQIQLSILSTLKKVSSPSGNPTAGVGHKTPEVAASLDSEDSVNKGKSGAECESSNRIPITLVKELQFLDRRYGFTMMKNDRDIESGIVYVTLKDPQLPIVPPLKLIISNKYPLEKPIVINFFREYVSNAFFRGVAAALNHRLSTLENQQILTVTEIISSWEISVRQSSDCFNV